MRTKPRIIAVAILLAVLAVFAYAILSGEREPTYDGRTLSEWTDAFTQANYRRDKQGREAASEAIRHMGTNALPWLLKWIEQKPFPWASELEILRSRRGGRWIPRWITGYQRTYRSTCASLALESLGPAAARAIPRLVELTKSRDRYLSVRGIVSLRCIGPEAVPALTRIWADTNNPADVRFYVSINLKDLLDQAGVNTSPDTTNRPVAVRAPILGNRTLLFTDEARAKLVMQSWLAATLTNGDYSFRLAATNALLVITPEALTNAPPQ